MMSRLIILIISMLINCYMVDIIMTADYGVGTSSGSGYGSSDNYGSIKTSISSSPPGPAVTNGGGSVTATDVASGQVVQAAVQSKHSIEFRDVPSTGQVVPTTIEVGANSVPVNILFRSASSSLNIRQMHDGAQGSLQETESEDEPHRLIHSVKKPIIQEIHEVITPFRKITQEIQPVQEEILTIVARGQDRNATSNEFVSISNDQPPPSISYESKKPSAQTTMNRSEYQNGGLRSSAGGY